MKEGIICIVEIGRVYSGETVIYEGTKDHIIYIWSGGEYFGPMRQVSLACIPAISGSVDISIDFSPDNMDK